MRVSATTATFSDFPVISSQEKPFRIGLDRRLGWVIDLGRRGYAETLSWQKSVVQLRRRGMIRDLLVMVEHPPVITLGKQSKSENLLSKSNDIPVFEIERGGDVTYHGPGQLVCYQIFDLTRRGRDMHGFIRTLEQGIIDALSHYDVSGKRVEGLTGVWVETPKGDRKIASIGVAAKHWISFHGVAVNLTTDLKSFGSINPCGLEANVMTSLKELTGKTVTTEEFAEKLTTSYAELFDTQFDPVSLDVIAEDLKSEEAGGHI